MENNKRTTQAARVLNYMKKFGTITQYEALADLGCMRLASRISELKTEGYAIKKRTVKVKNRYGESCAVAQYSLAE